MSSSFHQVSSRIELLNKDLSDIQALALDRLPGVPWDLTALQELLSEMAALLRAERALGAWQAYERFSVSHPAVLLGRISSAKKRFAARIIGWKGGKRSSERKRAACSINLTKARKAKALKNPKPAKSETDLKIEKQEKLKRLLKWKLNRESDHRKRFKIEGQIMDIDIRIRRIRLDAGSKV